MNKTGPRIIVLLMVIPLLLIITTSTVVNVTEILVDVPVSSVEILGEDNLHIAIDGKDESGVYDNSYRIETVVKPDDATHKNVTFTVEEVEGQKKAEVIIKAGVIRPLTEGTVRVVATAGARSDEIQITYTSDSVYSVKRTADTTLKVAEGKELSVKNYLSVYPEDAAYAAETEFSAPLKASLDKVTGVIIGKARGTTDLTIKIPGIAINEQDGTVTDCVHEVTLPVSVTPAKTASGISFAGEDNLYCATLGTYSAEFGYDIAVFGNRFFEEIPTFEISDPEALDSVTLVPNGDGTVKVTVTLSEKAVKNEVYEIKIKLGGVTVTKISVKNAPFLSDEVIIAAEKSYYQVGTKNVAFGIKADGDASDYAVEYFSDNPDVVYVTLNGIATMKKAGIATIRGVLYDVRSGERLDVNITSAVITVVDAYKSLVFKDKKAGIKNELAIAGYDVDIATGSVRLTDFVFGLSGSLSSGGTENAVDNASDKLIWRSSDTDVATVSDGKITVVSTGETTIAAESAYNDLLGLKQPVKAEITVTCRKDAVNVDTYEKLVFATKNEREIVLTSDVMLAPRIGEKDFTDYVNYLEQCTTEMLTTADYSYYKDNGKTSDANIRYAVEFTASVYGNGYSINGEYVTRSADYKGKTLFNGPLDLVRLKYDLSSEQNARVKAQDNIVFLVKKDGINIENVELKGCSDDSIKENGAINLGKLDKCGTVLEIVGNNCTVSYSHINNGRTVMRIFGKATEYDAAKLSANPERYRINATVNNCILENGREFILKLGSNQFKKNPSYTGSTLAPAATDADYADAAPFLTASDGTDYAVGRNYLNDSFFYDNYVMTDVTLQDSVFLNAGLFSVGFESKFSGVCLHGFDYSESWNFSKKGWQNVAGTSYPAVLRLKGDVRFYDWKDISRINSYTLIEGDRDTIGRLINLDMKTLMTNYVNNYGKSDMFVIYDGNTYVNGAITFYGGGRNYSFVDYSETGETFGSLADYSVPMAAFNSQPVIYCAGKNPFRFAIYDANNGITVEEQFAAKSDGRAYSWVRRRG